MRRTGQDACRHGPPALGPRRMVSPPYPYAAVPVIGKTGTGRARGYDLGHGRTETSGAAR